MYGKMFLVSVLAVLVCACNLMADMATIYPSDDASVDSAAGGTNYGSSSSISAGYGVLSAGIRRAYLKFDLSSVPAGRKIISARVRLDAGFVSIPAPQIGTHYLQEDTWTEGTITWNNAPTGFDPNASDTVTVSIDADYWTVTADVYDAYRSGETYSVVMKSTNEGSATAASFSSQEAIVSDWWPRLEVEHILAYSGGSGTAQYPYLIATAEDLNDIGNHPNDWDAQFRMTADINLAGYTGTQFNIIGSLSEPFTGVFDGNEHTIEGFTYNSNGVNGIGIFAKVSGQDAAIRDLGLIAADVNGGTATAIGSLAGGAIEATISGCYCTDCNVLGGRWTGGLVGMNASGIISDCYATGRVEGDDSVGGLAGHNGGQISHCHAEASVLSISGGVGGLIGFQNADGLTWDCYATGSVRAVTNAAGGFVGGHYGMTWDSHASGNAQGVQAVGGFAGSSFDSNINSCYATGSATGTDFVGALVGYGATATISNSYSTGSVTGNWAVGSLLGINLRTTISDCYAVGIVDGNSDVGGLVGLDGEDTWAGTYYSCFWNSDVNPDVNGIGNGDDPNVIGKTTAEMQTKNTFSDTAWDFVGESANGTNDFWDICEGTNYPKLAWQIPVLGDFGCPDGVDGIDLGVLCGEWLLEELSWDVWPNDGDGIVNFFDWGVFASEWKITNDIAELSDFAEQWLQTGVNYYIADIAPGPDGDGIVNFGDFAAQAANWVAGI